MKSEYERNAGPLSNGSAIICQLGPSYIGFRIPYSNDGAIYIFLDPI